MRRKRPLSPREQQERHERFQKGFAMLGFSDSDMRPIKEERDQARAQAMLDELKAKVKKASRRAALEHHPDKGGSRELLELALWTSDVFQTFQVRKAPPRPTTFKIQHSKVNIRFNGMADKAAMGWLSDLERGIYMEFLERAQKMQTMTLEEIERERKLEVERRKRRRPDSDPQRYDPYKTYNPWYTKGTSNK